MKPKRQRLIFVVLAACCLVAGTLLVLAALRDNIVFFLTPSEMETRALSAQQTVRLGGLVEQGSFTAHGAAKQFRVTDGKASVPVEYTGMLPDLFREGQGVVAEGTYAQGTFHASTVLAKHDETYMPPEVVAKLKASGKWRGR